MFPKWHDLHTGEFVIKISYFLWMSSGQPEGSGLGDSSDLCTDQKNYGFNSSHQ